MTKISKNSEVSKAKTEKNVPVQKEAKKVVGIINEDGSVINFKSLEEAKEIGFKLRKQVKQLDYIKTNITFLEKVSNSAIENTGVVSDNEESDEYGILLLPMGKLRYISDRFDDNEYTIIRKQEVVAEFSKFTLKVLKHQSDLLQNDILNIKR